MATTLEEEHLMSIHAQSGGIYRRIKQPGDEVEQGEAMAEILDPFEGTVIEEIKAPANGIVFLHINLRLYLKIQSFIKL